jgi:hypothetical protein
MTSECVYTLISNGYYMTAMNLSGILNSFSEVALEVQSESESESEDQSNKSFVTRNF